MTQTYTDEPRVPRLPPHSLESEQGTLGSILLDNEILPAVRDVIPDPGMFYRAVHQDVYAAILALADRGEPADALTVREELRRMGRFEAIGGDTYLSEILESVPHAANAVYYAQYVRIKHVDRSLLSACTQTISDVEGNQYSAEELIGRATERVFGLATTKTESTITKIAQAAEVAYERIATRRKGAWGLSSGFPDVDRMTDGFQEKQVIVLAARPSAGKTSMALNIAEWVAFGSPGVDPKPVLFFSLEMGQAELAERLLVARSKVDASKFRDPDRFSYDDKRRLGQAYADMADAPLWIDDAPARNMTAIMSDARRWKRTHSVSLVVIDYLQLITPTDGRANRQEQVAQMSRGCKLLARELDVPVLLLSQLNRQVESRADKRPMMSDLRESGAIEQDADVVLLLDRKDIWDKEAAPGESQLIVAKNRNGPTGTVKLTFVKEQTRFEPALETIRDFD
jgi:replicative DNA helicase